jgi:hypothetical protein
MREFCCFIVAEGARGGAVVEALRYKPEGRGIGRIFPAGKIHSMQYDTIQTTNESPIPEQ